MMEPIQSTILQSSGNMKRIELLEMIAALATELCIAVDRESEDIGGSRPSLKILQDIGPLTDQLERTPK